jgi:teichuronic acid biosynthesis glycosyltransferase TuaC
LRALVVSNMLPDTAHPERGRFVRDQVAALRELVGVEVELYEFAPGPPALARAAVALRRRHRERFDVVHAHFGLTAWPALLVPARTRALTLHGSDLRHPRTRLLSAAVLPAIDLLATASEALVAELPSRRARARARVLPCGVDLERFVPVPRTQARSQLELAADEPFVLFPADPARPEKRHDRALALARAAGVRLRALGGVDPGLVPLWVNAANAVLVPSEREGFGLAALEALACDVPVLATPVGAHPSMLDGIEGALCAPFELEAWRLVLEAHVHTPDPRVEGRGRAAGYSTHAMATRVAGAWREALSRSAQDAG